MSDRVNRTAAHENSAKGVLLQWPKRRIDPDVHIYCAYNPSRESFLCSFVETVDAMPENLREHLDKLTPGSHKAIWLIPFRGIAADHLNAPIDLIFLDQNYCVVAMTQSFPASNPGSCNWPVGSAIALPPGSIAASGTLAGDQVILCSPQKMKRRLSELHKSPQDGREFEMLSHNAYSIPHSVSSELRADIRISNWDDLLKQAPHEHSAIVPAAAATTTSDQHKMPEDQASSKSRNWLFCLLAPHRKDKRKSPRESLPWVAAYFFTGGTPAPATICNISSLGMYVKTSERWYPGTIIHVTLTDWRLPSTDRVVTVNAMAVRSDDLGVGLRFVFPNPRRGRATPDEAAMTGVTREQLGEFLQHFKGKSRHSSWHHKC